MVHKEPRPRGRPRSFDPDTALDRARGAFWNSGYAATSLDDLAAATGLSRPSLYGAFGDKHELYIASLERSRAESAAAMAQVMALRVPLRQTLEILYDGASRIYRAGENGPRGCFLIGTAVTQAVDDPAARAVLAAAVTDADQAFAARFVRADIQGDLPAHLNAADTAKVATAVLHELAIRARCGDGEAELKRIANAAIILICGPAEADLF